MASIAGSSVSFKPSPQALLSSFTSKNYGQKPSVCFWRRNAPRMPALRVMCSVVPSPQTIDKVAKIVKEQLAVPDATTITGESEFSTLGADSLDTVEIVMKLEEEFGVTVEEEEAQDIKTIADAAKVIEKLAAKK